MYRAHMNGTLSHTVLPCCYSNASAELRLSQ